MTDTPTETIITIDRVHRAIRSGDRWAVQRHMPDGTWDALDMWSGGRRSLIQWLDRRRIVPSREAERQLADIPEATGFRDR